MQKILADLSTQPLPRIILAHGPELFWQEQIFAILRERNFHDPLAEWNWSVFYGSKEFDPEPFVAELATVAWGDYPKIVVLRDGDLIPAATWDVIVTWLEANPNSNPLAIFLAKVDKRLKSVKALQKIALEIECDFIQGEALVRYLVDYTFEQGKKFDRATAQLFLERVGSNLMVIHGELAKVINYTGERAEITKEDVLAITSLSPRQIENHTIFQLTEYIIRKKRAEALDVLNQLVEAGESPLRILPLIERELRLVLAAKTCGGRLAEAARQMGEKSSYPLEKALPYAKNFSLDELVAGFAAIVQGDRKMKLGVPGDQVLTDLIIQLT